MKYHYRKGGKPRYKGYGKLKSLERKSNKTGIRFIDNKLIWGRKLEIPAILKENDIVQTHGLNQRIKYVRVVKKSIRGSVKYFVQLILEGEAFNKFEAEETCNAERIVRGNIGIDLGPQTIAYVGNEKAEIRVLAEKITRIIKDKKKIQQKLSRKLRLLNPDQFEDNFKKKIKRNSAK